MFPAGATARVSLLAWSIVALLATAACNRPGTPPAAPPVDQAPPAAEPRPPSSIAAEMARAGRDAQREAPARSIDWSGLPASTWGATGRTSGQDGVAVKACLRASLLEKQRCTELQRMLARGVNDADVRAAIAVVNASAPALAGVWRERFAAAGRTFAVPEIRYYGWTGDGAPGLSEQSPACGELLDNAFYCLRDNQIYYDVVFLARLANAVRIVDKTPGTYAVASVVSHEMGHAVDVQLGITGLVRYKRELIADCFSGVAVGAVVRAAAGPSQARQVLETTTPMTEGQLAMFLVGGPAMVDGDHPAGPVRAGYFTRGFNLGVAECTLNALEGR